MSDKVIKPWTIKGIPDEERNAAIAAAGRERMLIGDWIVRAIRTQIQADLNREQGVTVVTNQTHIPYNATAPVLYEPPVALAELVETAIRASNPDLDPEVRTLINKTLLDQVRDLRRARRSQGKLHHGRNERHSGDPDRH